MKYNRKNSSGQTPIKQTPKYLVYDVEVPPHSSPYVGFYDPQVNEVWQVHIDTVFEAIKEQFADYIWIGFNNHRYDNLIINGSLENAKFLNDFIFKNETKIGRSAYYITTRVQFIALKEFLGSAINHITNIQEINRPSQDDEREGELWDRYHKLTDVIKNKRSDELVCRFHRSYIENIRTADILELLSAGNTDKNESVGNLKLLEAKLGHFYPRYDDTYGVSYNKEDLKGTWEVFNAKDLAPMSGIDTIEAINALFEELNITKRTVIQKKLFSPVKIAGHVLNSKMHPNSYFNYDWHLFSKIENSDLHFLANPMRLHTQEKYIKDQMDDPRLQVRLCNNHIQSYIVKGGAHWAKEEVFLQTKEDLFLYNIDFASFYPWILYHVGLIDKDSCDYLRHLIEQRLKYKNSGDKLKSNALKLLINSLYGQLDRSQHSNLSTLPVCLMGQTLIYELCEKVYALGGVDILAINTDGIILKSTTPIDQTKWKHFHSDVFNIDLAVDCEALSRYEALNVNNYILWNHKGEIIKSSGSWISNKGNNNCFLLLNFKQIYLEDALPEIRSVAKLTKGELKYHGLEFTHDKLSVYEAKQKVTRFLQLTPSCLTKNELGDYNFKINRQCKLLSKNELFHAIQRGDVKLSKGTEDAEKVKWSKAQLKELREVIMTQFERVKIKDTSKVFDEWMLTLEETGNANPIIAIGEYFNQVQPFYDMGLFTIPFRKDKKNFTNGLTKPYNPDPNKHNIYIWSYLPSNKLDPLKPFVSNFSKTTDGRKADARNGAERFAYEIGLITGKDKGSVCCIDLDNYKTLFESNSWEFFSLIQELKATTLISARKPKRTKSEKYDGKTELSYIKGLPDHIKDILRVGSKVLTKLFFKLPSDFTKVLDRKDTLARFGFELVMGGTNVRCTSCSSKSDLECNDPSRIIEWSPRNLEEVLPFLKWIKPLDYDLKETQADELFIEVLKTYAKENWGVSQFGGNQKNSIKCNCNVGDHENNSPTRSLIYINDEEQTILKKCHQSSTPPLCDQKITFEELNVYALTKGIKLELPKVEPEPMFEPHEADISITPAQGYKPCPISLSYDKHIFTGIDWSHVLWATSVKNFNKNDLRTHPHRMGRGIIALSYSKGGLIKSYSAQTFCACLMYAKECSDSTLRYVPFGLANHIDPDHIGIEHCLIINLEDTTQEIAFRKEAIETILDFRDKEAYTRACKRIDVISINALTHTRRVILPEKISDYLIDTKAWESYDYIIIDTAIVASGGEIGFDPKGTNAFFSKLKMLTSQGKMPSVNLLGHQSQMSLGQKKPKESGATGLLQVTNTCRAGWSYTSMSEYGDFKIKDPSDQRKNISIRPIFDGLLEIAGIKDICFCDNYKINAKADFGRYYAIDQATGVPLAIPYVVGESYENVDFDNVEIINFMKKLTGKQEKEILFKIKNLIRTFNNTSDKKNVIAEKIKNYS